MTPEQFDAFLTVAKKHGVTILRIGEVVLGGSAPSALAPVPFVPGGLPDAPKLDLKSDPSDPVAHWDRVDSALWPGGSPT